jgi:hypothetical protein
MIIIKTKHLEFKYYGACLILFHEEDKLYIESHGTIPRHESDEMIIWANDVFDWFWTKDIISIVGIDEQGSADKANEVS